MKINLNILKTKLFENLVSLSILQGANYVLPLITVPYLVRVLGPEKFGLVAFAQAFVQYFTYFTDYGFNFSATREISINRHDRKRVAEIFSCVMLIKVVFALISLLVFAAIVLSFAKFRDEWPLYAFAFLALGGNVLFPQWFFQGMERMKYITVLNLSARLLFIVLIFVFVHSEQGYFLVALFQSLGLVLAALTGLLVVFGYFKVGFKLPKFASVRRELRNGYSIFITQIAPSLYTTSNVFLLGLLTNNLIVGYYSAGEKIVKAVQAMFSPVSQAIFPHMSYLVETSKASALNFIRKVTVLSAAATFIISVLIFIFAPQIVLLVLGEKYLATIAVIRILAFLPFVCSLGAIMGTHIMINFGLAHYFAGIVSAAGLFNILLAVLLIVFFKQNGMAAAVMTTESLITLTMFIILERKSLSPRRKWVDRV
ncbi:MAG TPA: flippase [Candidatus Omnitrophota bacterium]|nr:flippase [Candidatus Omnitrophota bacterium]